MELLPEEIVQKTILIKPYIEIFPSIFNLSIQEGLKYSHFTGIDQLINSCDDYELCEKIYLNLVTSGQLKFIKKYLRCFPSPNNVYNDGIFRLASLIRNILNLRLVSKIFKNIIDFNIVSIYENIKDNYSEMFDLSNYFEMIDQLNISIDEKLIEKRIMIINEFNRLITINKTINSNCTFPDYKYASSGNREFYLYNKLKRHELYGSYFSQNGLGFVLYVKKSKLDILVTLINRNLDYFYAKQALCFKSEQIYFLISILKLKLFSTKDTNMLYRLCLNSKAVSQNDNIIKLLNLGATIENINSLFNDYLNQVSDSQILIILDILGLYKEDPKYIKYVFDIVIKTYFLDDIETFKNFVKYGYTYEGYLYLDQKYNYGIINYCSYETNLDLSWVILDLLDQ